MRKYSRQNYAVEDDVRKFDVLAEGVTMFDHVSPQQLRRNLVRFCVFLSLAIIVTNLVVVFLLSYLPNHHYAIYVVALNVTASLASTLDVTTLFRSGISGIHGQSLLFLTIGIITWLLADLTLAYGHFILHNEEEQSLVVPIADLYWIVGYVFSSLHLFASLKLVRRTEIHKLSIFAVVALVGDRSLITSCFHQTP